MALAPLDWLFSLAQFGIKFGLDNIHALVAELGHPDFEAVAWHSLVVPAGTPKAIVTALHSALMQTINDPQIRTQLTNLGVDVMGNSPEEFRAYIKSEGPKWGAIVKAANVKMQQ